MRARGVELIEYGNDFQDALEQAEKLSKQRGLHWVPSFHTSLMKGVASYSLELFRSVPDLDVLYVPIGLGSGICGAISAREALRLRTEIVGVVSEAGRAYADSFAARAPVSRTVAPTIVDGMACRVPNEEALAIILAHASRVITVSEREIRAAMRRIYTATHNVAEGAGAAALAAAFQERARLRGRRVAAVLSGSNVDRNLFREALAEND